MKLTPRFGIGALVVAVVVAVPARAAFAHADLVTSQPTAGAILDFAPNDITLTFSEPVDPVEDSIRLVDASGVVLDIGRVNQTRGVDTLGTSISDELPDGSYVIAWRALSADSHLIKGALVYSVGDAATTDLGLIQDVLDSDSGSDPGSRWIGIGRLISFAGIALCNGGLFTVAVCAPALLGTRRAGRLMLAAAVAAAAGTVAMIGGQAATIGSSATDLTAVIDTRSGSWWLARLIGVAVIAVGVRFRARLTSSEIGRVVAVVGAVGLLVTVAGGGHAVSGRAIPVGFAATVIHLGAMSVWAGGLAAMLLVVPTTQLPSVAARFSRLALTAVIILAVTGLVNAFRQIGGFGEVIDGDYGRWLIAKLVVVAIVVAIAARSRSLLHRDARVDASVEVGSDDVSDATGLKASMAAEAVGMMVIFGLTTALVGSPPPRVAPPANASASAVRGDRIAEIELEPAVTGGTVMHVTIVSPNGSLNGADEITVVAALPARQVGPLDIPVDIAGPNHVVTNDAYFPIAGIWEITVTARFGEFDQAVFTAQLEVDDK
ncbi:MAG: copper resistance CopC/CopD family protein [Acidimicrobiia bacterium]